MVLHFVFFFSSRRRHTRWTGDWSSDVCSSDLLNLVPPDSHEAGRLLAQHGWYSGFIDADHSQAQRAFQRALSIAQRQDDAALERRTLANAAWVDVWHLRSQDCLEKGLRAIELAS